MKNKKTYIVKIDWEKKEILDEKFELIIEGFTQTGVDYQLQLIDINNVMDLHINTIVNEFIKHCKMEDNKKPIVVNIRLLKAFIVNLLKLFSISQSTIVSQQDVENNYPVDIIAPNRMSFRVNIPKKYLSDRYDEMIAMGADWLMGSFDDNVLIDYVLPSFYLFLFKNDLFEDEKCIDLAKYKFGLA